MNDTPSQEPALKPEELLPCPFCGCRNVHLVLSTPTCADCGAQGPWQNVEGWNTRPVPPTAAPVGKVDLHALVQAETSKRYPYGGQIDREFARIFSEGAMWVSALAAAPVTGDRETAGVEPVAWRLHRPGHGWGSVWQGPARPSYPLDDGEELVPLYATPPSGGGDHAGGEAPSDGLTDAGRWVYGAGYRDGYVDGRTADTEWPADDGFELVKEIDSTSVNDGWDSAKDTFNGMVKRVLATAPDARATAAPPTENQSISSADLLRNTAYAAGAINERGGGRGA